MPRAGRRKQPIAAKSKRSSNKFASKNYGLRSLVHEIVQSDLFRTK